MSKLEKIKRIIQGDAAAQRSLRRALPMFYFFTGCVAYWEVLMHVAMFESISWRILYVLAFTVFWGAFATFLCGFGKERTGKIILWVTQSVMCLWYMCQTIYYRVFGGFISLYLVKMGGTAITNFFKETLECILRNLWFLALLALPLVATAILQKKGFFALKRRGGKIQGRMAIICALIHLVACCCCPLAAPSPTVFMICIIAPTPAPMPA